MVFSQIYAGWIRTNHPRLHSAQLPHTTMSKEDEKQVRKILVEAAATKYSVLFRTPFDYITAGLDDYPLKVKKPMDLKTLFRNFESKKYASLSDINDDFYLILDNAITFIGPEQTASIAAEALYLWFVESLIDCKLLVIPDSNSATVPRSVSSSVSKPLDPANAAHSIEIVRFESLDSTEGGSALVPMAADERCVVGRLVELYCEMTGKDRRSLIFWSDATKLLVLGTETVASVT